MAKDPYASARKAADRLIKSKGSMAKFMRAAGAVQRDPITQNEVSTGEGGEWLRPVVGLPPGKTWQMRGHTQVSQTTEELHVSPQGYSPLIGDKVYWRGAVLKVLDAVIYDPANSGTPIYFRVLVE